MDIGRPMETISVFLFLHPIERTIFICRSRSLSLCILPNGNDVRIACILYERVRLATISFYFIWNCWKIYLNVVRMENAWENERERKKSVLINLNAKRRERDTLEFALDCRLCNVLLCHRYIVIGIDDRMYPIISIRLYFQFLIVIITSIHNVYEWRLTHGYTRERISAVSSSNRFTVRLTRNRIQRERVRERANIKLVFIYLILIVLSVFHSI